MTQQEIKYLDNFVSLIEQLNPIGSDISLDDVLLIKDKSSNVAKSVTVADLIGYTGGSGTANRIVKYTAGGQTESILLDNGNSILLDSGKTIKSASGLSVIDFGTTGNNWIALDTFNNSFTKGWVYIDGVESSIGFGDNVIVTRNDVNSVYSFTTGLLSQINIANPVISAAVNHEMGVIINSRNSRINAGVVNTVVLGGNGNYAKNSNSVYVPNICYASDANFTTVVSFDTPTVNRFISFPDAGGTVALIEDLPQIITVSATLNFPAIGANSFEDLTIAAPGTEVSDPVALGVENISMTNEVVFVAFVSALNVVTVRAINTNGNTPNPVSGFFQVKILK